MRYLQGNIHWVDLRVYDKRLKLRPCLIISGNLTCSRSNSLTVIPLKSLKHKRGKVGNMEMIATETNSIISFTTFYTINKKHVQEYFGRLTSDELDIAKRKIKYVLGLE